MGKSWKHIAMPARDWGMFSYYDRTVMDREDFCSFFHTKRMCEVKIPRLPNSVRSKDRLNDWTPKIAEIRIPQASRPMLQDKTDSHLVAHYLKVMTFEEIEFETPRAPHVSRMSKKKTPHDLFAALLSRAGKVA